MNKKYRMSSAQKRMFIINQMQEANITYNVPIIMNVEGALNIDRLNRALDQLSSRHELLRTHFLQKNDNFIQEVEECIEIYAEYGINTDSDIQGEIKSFLRPFDLCQAPLMRVKVLKTSEDNSILMIDIHHIIFDGWSTDVLFHDLTHLYNGCQLPELGLQYKDYSAWQNGKDLHLQEEYWLNEFSQGVSTLNLLTDFPRPSQKTYNGDTIYTKLSADVKNDLRILSNKIETTDYMLLLSAVMLLLQKYSRQEEIIIGSPIAGRVHPDTQSMLGMFVNTLAIKANVDSNLKFIELVKQVKEKWFNAYENQEYPFEELVEKLDIERDISRNPMFEVMFVLQNNEKNTFLFDGAAMRPIDFEYKVAKFDLTINIEEIEDEYVIRWEYCTDLFSNKTIERMGNHFAQLLLNIIEDPEKRVNKLSMLPDIEYNSIVNEFNNTKTDFPKNNTIIDLFEEQVLKYPGDVSVMANGLALTYQELNEKSNKLAMKLRQLGVKAEEFVGIITERNNETIVGMLGILKAGGAYMPIDSQYPQERIDFLMNDSQSKIVLTSSEILHDFENEDLIILDLLDKTLYTGTGESVLLDRVNTSYDLAYLIYTSGTTGNPKGVMIEHRSVLRLIRDTNYLNFEKIRILQTGSLAFDASTFEIWGALLNGGCVCIAEEDVLSSARLLHQAIKNYDINTMFLTTALFNQMISINNHIFDSLTQLLFGGEATSEEYVRMLVNTNRNIKFSNVYGPTENTTFTSYYPITDIRGKTPIGKPISNTQIYVMNDSLLCGIGVPGELCIGGDGVARGYFNRQELTDEKFITNPFNVQEKMYKSGDLVRWLEDGNIEYLGRLDEQVKLRGFRIELGEIENRLREIDAIKDVVVVVGGRNEDKYLCSYIISDKACNVASIKVHLSKYLPEYMIPKYIMQLDHIPITKNGKTNKKELPEPSIESSREYIEPRNKIEETIAEVFKEVLDIQKIGIDDSFFELGGHSLRAVRLVNMVESKLGVRITLRDILAQKSVKNLAEMVSELQTESMNDVKAFSSIQSIPKQNSYITSSAQKRMYLIDQIQEKNTTYNIPMIFKINGKLIDKKLARAFDKLAERHEILRTRFELEGDSPVQIVDENTENNLEVIELENDNIQEMIKEFIQPFDLSCTPLFRTRLAKSKGGDRYLLIDMHHIIFDGGSLAALFGDLKELYEGNILNPINVQYKDFSVWQNSRDMSLQEKYWLNEFSGAIPSLNLLTDYSRSNERSFRGAVFSDGIHNQEIAAIEALSGVSDTTEYIVMLSVLMIFLNKYSQQNEIIIGSPIAGRTSEETQNMVGMFVNTLAIKGNIDYESSFIKFVEQIKEKCLNAFENQDYPFDELVEKLELEADSSRNPLFDVMFAFQNNDGGEISLEDATLSPVPCESDISKFDLTLNIEKNGKGYKLDWEYCTDLYKLETIERMSTHFQELLKNILRNPNEKIASIGLLSLQEKEKIIYEFNQTKTDFSEKATIVELFEEQVKINPEKIAVVLDDDVITYEELNKKSNQLALKLRKRGVLPDSFVGIVANRQIETIVGLLGILKAGGAYLPIDTKYPISRIEFMIRDSGTNIVLTDNSDKLNINNSEVEFINIAQNSFYTEVHTDLTHINKPIDLAYVIYTSGTTGEPKGAMIEHRSVNRLVKNTNYVDFTDGRILQTGSLAFDASTFEIWGALLNGGTLYIANEEVLSSEIMLKQTLLKYDINTMFITTALFNQMISLDEGIFDSLSQLMFGGETTSEIHVKMLINRNNKIRFSNVYGPTENTTFTTFYDIDSDSEMDRTPIGKPISNSQVYIMNHTQLCGIGMPGELYIGGAGLSRGYLNRAELTSQKFIENPFQKGEKLYKSGDLAKWKEDGNIEFLGRIDAQVKIRGFRIELGEIESHLRQIPEISDAIVIAHENNGDKSIYGYIIANKAMEIDDIKKSLNEKLPDYMIPSHIIQMEKFTLNKNGKIDKEMLPKPEIKGGKEYAAPGNKKEKCTYKAFSEVLGVEEFGIDDSFFELGGDSIKAIRIVSKIREYGYHLNVRSIMKNRSVRLIASKISDSKVVLIDQSEVTGAVPLSPIQHEFFDYNLAAPNHFNQSMMLECSERINTIDLDLILTEIVKHHDQLRAVYIDRKQSIESFHKSELYHLLCIDFMHIDQEEELWKEIDIASEKIQSGIDISKGPLLQAGLFKTAEKDYLLMCIHHLAVDGVSWRVLVEDLSKGYSNLKKFKKIIMPDKTMSYQKWCESLGKYGNTESVQSEIGYWMDIEEKVIESKSHLSKSAPDDSINELMINFNEEKTFQLLYQAGRAYNTEINDLLLTALFRAIGEITGKTAVSVNMEGHGREFISKEILIDRTVGWFTSIYPVAVIGIGETIQKDIDKVKEILRKIPNNGMWYGVLKHLDTNDLEGVESDITFNYLGEFGQESDLGIFKMSAAAHGSDVSVHNKFGSGISINGAVIDKKLQLTVSYNEKLYSEGFINDLISGYAFQMSELIEHCIEARAEERPIGLDKQNQLSDISQVVWSIFSADSIVKEIQVNDDVYRVLFVENMNMEQRSNITKQMGDHVPIENLPNYLVSMEKYVYSTPNMNEDSFRKMCCNEQITNCTEIVQLAMNGYKKFTERSVVANYPAPAMQKSFLKMASHVIVKEKIVLEGLYSEREIIDGIKEIIRKNDVLRMSYQIINGEFIVFEHTYNDDWDIPYVDLGYSGIESREATEAVIFNDDLWLYRSGEKNNLSIIVVTKESEIQHVVNIVTSHAVWDKTSTQIFQDGLENLLSTEVQEEVDNKQYREYVQEIVENAEMKKSVNKDFIDSANMFAKYNSNKELKGFGSSIIKMGKYTSLYFRDNTWNTLAFIVDIILTSNKLISKKMNSYPLLILQEDRRYMREDYTNTLGAFLDALPIVVPSNPDINNSNIESYINSYQRTKKEKHINLLNDIMDQDKSVSIEKIPLINYHGIFDLSYEALQKTMELLEKQKSQIGYYEIYINNYMDYLSVAFPVFGQSAEWISQNIQEGMNQFEEKIARLLSKDKKVG